jgi:2-methylisocitrate lyase-like PEP mutase family enzyme
MSAEVANRMSAEPTDRMSAEVQLSDYYEHEAVDFPYRAMSRAAEIVYRALREAGTQRHVIDRLQTREELYEVLGYYRYERKLDELFGTPRPPSAGEDS